MPSILTFVVPVRHPENTRDRAKARANLAQTLASIAAQSHPAWRAVVVANHGAELPPMPKGVEIVRVDFPPNAKHDYNLHGYEDSRDAVRLDKGRRLLAGMLAGRDTHFYMVVDDDDLVSRRLVEFVAQNRTANGWIIREGYVWGDGGRLLFMHNRFWENCGTSLIIRADLYALPDNPSEASEDYIKTMVGSHTMIASILKRGNTPLAPLPFRGAVYRIGHPVSHSRKAGIAQFLFITRKAHRNPRELLSNLTRLRLMNEGFKEEFFGLHPGDAAGER